MPRSRDTVLRLTDLFNVAEWQDRIAWEPFRDGVEIFRLYGDGVQGPTAALLKFAAGAGVPLHEHVGYEHILVLSGAQVDENSRAEAGTLIVNPPATRHSVFSANGCIVLAIYERPVRFVEEGSASRVPRVNRGSGRPESQSTDGSRRASMSDSILLAVNGTLMRGLALNANLTGAGAAFVSEARTTAEYRLWSIGDRHPAMLRVRDGGVAIALEIWRVPAAGVASVLQAEPAGLSIGKVRLEDGREVLGVLGEPWLCEGQREISAFGGWRDYLTSITNAQGLDGRRPS